MANHSEIVSFIWGVADLIRDSFKRGHYQDVILPFTVLRRIDLVLAPTKSKVLEVYNKYKDKLDNLGPQLCKASGFSFYNTSKYDFETLLDEPQQMAANLKAYINGFSKNMRDVIEKFEFESTISKLDSANLLFKVLQRFADKTKADLSPDAISNHEMGYVFEELIRKFNEALDENPGEHFTPREVIRLMAALMTFHDRAELSAGKVIRTVYDPCCGSGGMLTIGKEQIQSINAAADVHLFGQEVNPQTFAMCKSDLYMKSADGRDADNIAFGSTLSQDGHADRTFDYLLANPPYGKDWNLDQDEVRKEAARASKNRFEAGLPRINDGQLLFLQHMLGRMHHPDEGTSRVCIIMNGSPLFTGDAKSGESEIRRWILENDYLEALIALPQQLFYNTGISTYIWVLSNKKDADRADKVLLIDASEAWLLRQKSLGAKRRDIPDGVERTENFLPYIIQAFDEFQDQSIIIPTNNSENAKQVCSKVFPTAAFGFRKVTIERPLRLNFQASEERIARIENASAFKNMANSRKKNAKERQAEMEAGEATQVAIRGALKTLPKKVYTDRDEFTKLLEKALKKAEIKVAASVRRAILDALSERDPDAPICLDKDGLPEADTSLRDTESVPLNYLDEEGIAEEKKVAEFFEREVKPHVPDAWINETVRDEKDGEVGLVGYEVNFNRYFYQYQPPRALELIEGDIKDIENNLSKLLSRIIGGTQDNRTDSSVRKWRRYKNHKPLGLSWELNVPSHWEVRRLKFLADVRPSNVDKKSVDGEVGVKLCNYTDVYNNEFILEDFDFMEATASDAQIAAFELCADDVIITKDSETWEDIAVPTYVPNRMPGVVCGYHLALIRPDQTMVDGYYLAKCFEAEGINNQFQVAANGITRFGLGTQDIRCGMFPIPPSDERKAINSFLQCELKRLDELTGSMKATAKNPLNGHLGRLVTALKEYRTALISAAVTGQIDVREEVQRDD